MALSARQLARRGSSLLEFPSPGGGWPTPLSGKQPCAWGGVSGLAPSFFDCSRLGVGGENRQAEWLHKSRNKG